MKVRLILFFVLYIAVLFLVVERTEGAGGAALRLTTPLPALAAKRAKPQFWTNVLIFDPSMPSQEIQKQIDAVYCRPRSTTSLGRSGMRSCFCRSYSVDVPVGFYTEVMGLGASPDATRITGNVHADANHEHNNATTTFWRQRKGSR